MRHKKAIIALFLVFAMAMGGVIAFSMCQIGSDIIDYHEAEVLYQDYSDNFLSSVDTEGYDEMSPISINFDLMAETDPNVVAWIYQEGTVINYPVAQGPDNEYYVERTLDGRFSAAGTIFLDALCAKDFSSDNNILYGHHMMDGSMFQTISKYRRQEYYDEHPVMYLNTPDQNYKIEIFCCRVTRADSDAYVPYFSDDAAFQSWLDEALSQNLISTDVEVSTASKVITLSTCAYEYEGARTVVHGVLTPIG